MSMQHWIKPLQKHIAEQIQAIWDFTAGLKADTISESTTDAGVTCDGVLFKDGTVNIPSDVTPATICKLGTLEIQSYGLTTFCISKNAYYNGSVWKHRSTGAVMQLVCDSGEFLYRTATSQAADTTISWTYPLSVKSTGRVGISNNNPATLFDIISKVFVDSSGNVGIGAASAGEKCEVTGAIKTVYVSDTDSDTDDVLSTGITAKFGLVLIKETTGNKFCLFRIKGDNSAPIIIDGDAEFAAVKDNASTYNFYYETDQFKLQNKVGNDKALYVGLYLV